MDKRSDKQFKRVPKAQKKNSNPLQLCLNLTKLKLLLVRIYEKNNHQI